MCTEWHGTYMILRFWHKGRYVALYQVYHVVVWENSYMLLPILCSRWLPMLPRLVDMTASLWRHHQTNWTVRSAFLLPIFPTKWHAVGRSTVKPAWRNTPVLAQTAGKLASQNSIYSTKRKWSSDSTLEYAFGWLWISSPIGEQEIKSQMQQLWEWVWLVRGVAIPGQSSQNMWVCSPSLPK